MVRHGGALRSRGNALVRQPEYAKEQSNVFLETIDRERMYREGLHTCEAMEDHQDRRRLSQVRQGV